MNIPRGIRNVQMYAVRITLFCIHSYSHIRCNSGMLLIMSFYQLSQECSGKFHGSFPCISTAFRHSMMGPFFLPVVSPTNIRVCSLQGILLGISPHCFVFGFFSHPNQSQTHSSFIPLTHLDLSHVSSPPDWHCWLLLSGFMMDIDTFLYIATTAVMKI